MAVERGRMKKSSFVSIHPLLEAELREGILEEVTPELGVVAGIEVYPGKDKGERCSATGTCLSKALCPQVCLILQASPSPRRDSASSAPREAPTTASGSLLKGPQRSWPNSVASKGVLLPQACHLLSGMHSSGCHIVKGPPPTTHHPETAHSLDPSPSIHAQHSSSPISRWLCNASIDTRTRRWAVEGLAYLTLDADVKDDFVQDIPALQAMFELAKASVALTSGLREGLLGSGSHGPLLNLGNGTAVSSPWLRPSYLCKTDWLFPPVWPLFYLTIKWAHDSSWFPGSGKMNKRMVLFSWDPQEVRS